MIPNPGSDAANKLGCMCPVMDNNHGISGSYYGKGIWIYVENCPLHNPGWKEKEDAEENRD